jgi:hypothetical protein
MNWEVLLHWLTHLGEGSWAAFRRTLLELGGPDLDVDAASWRARVRLSDLAHVDFFVGGERRWQALAPVLGGLPDDPAVAVLCGGRTPRLVEDLATASMRLGCGVTLLDVADGPRQVRLEGGQEAIAAVGTAVGLSYVPNIAAALCWTLEPIQMMLQDAVAEAPPINWAVRSFDLDRLNWADQLLPRTAYEYSSRHGERRYYVRGPGRGLLRMNRRAAVYAAAMFNSVSLAHYDAAARCLSTPVNAPLPEAYSRIATLCSGKLSVVSEGRRIHQGVPPKTAAVLLVAAGQPHPEPYWFSAGKGRS